MQAEALTVTALNEYVRRSLAGDPLLRRVSVRGEISNYKPYVSGHWYFSLKDDSSRLNCVMFRQYNMSLRFRPRDGMNVVLFGSAGLYVANGSYQFYAEDMQEDGVGELYRRFLALKERLTAEGLFDPARKQPLPLLPRAVGIVTSASGAVLHDIVTVTRRRFPNMPLVLRPCQVQGEGAAQDLAQGLVEIAQLDTVDVIIIGRGGGSMEDLWAFNEEVLVRAVAACPKPVVSAVGHETDVTLCDFAADMRAATPSAAAELAVPDKAELLARCVGLHASLWQIAHGTIMQLAARLGDISSRLDRQSPEATLQRLMHRHEVARKALDVVVNNMLSTLHTNLYRLQSTLKALDPQQTLKRGYVLALHNGRPVTSVRHAPKTMTLLFQDGQADVRLLSAQREDQSDEHKN